MIEMVPSGAMAWRDCATVLGPPTSMMWLDAEFLGREFLGRLAPRGWVFFVVQHMVCSQLLQPFGFLRGGGRGDDFRAGRLRELKREDGDPARALREDPVPRFERLADEAVEGIPGREGRAG